MTNNLSGHAGARPASLIRTPSKTMASVLIHNAARSGKNLWQRVFLRARFSCLYGPRSLQIGAEEFVVVCMVKNGEFFVEEFIDYYTTLGAKHIVFVDNGSTDKTVSLAKKHSHVTILRCTLPVKRFETEIRRFAANLFCKDGWCLFADIDELLDYPGRPSMPMKGLLGYLNSKGYTAAMGQLLDMYPAPGDGSKGENFESHSFESTHDWYETTNIEYAEYCDPISGFGYLAETNITESPEFKIAFGGVRKRLFGISCCLTKHPLVRMASGVVPATHAHCSSGVRCADITVILKHYKFAGDYAARFRAELFSASWDHGENKQYVKAIDQDKVLEFTSEHSRRYSSPDDLVDQKFVHVSDSYRDWVAERPAGA